MRLFRSREVVGTVAGALDFTPEASVETYPDEYMGLLCGEEVRRVGVDRDGYIAVDALIIPGTVLDPYSATVRSDLVPNDFHAVGSIRSHPNGVLRPSDADLDMFGSGRIHIIIGSPHGPDDWEAFDQSGKVRDLDVLDADLSDPKSFFDFAQDDIDAKLDR